MAGRVVEDDAADRTILLEEHFAGNRLVEHGYSLSVRVIVIASAAKQSRPVEHPAQRDCFVAALLAMTGVTAHPWRADRRWRRRRSRARAGSAHRAGRDRGSRSASALARGCASC